MTRVLLIEDDPAIHRLYKRLLDLQEGFEVESADNGLSGLELIPVFHPDIVLLDIVLPTMDGMEFLSNLKSDPTTKQIPVIVVTNLPDSGTADQAISHGAELCLVKSQTEPDQLIEAIKKTLEQTSAI
jgi:CheY-like chemotaxis protein